MVHKSGLLGRVGEAGVKCTDPRNGTPQYPCTRLVIVVMAWGLIVPRPRSQGLNPTRGSGHKGGIAEMTFERHVAAGGEHAYGAGDCPPARLGAGAGPQRSAMTARTLPWPSFSGGRAPKEPR